jgi:hypothetical protein
MTLVLEYSDDDKFVRVVEWDNSYEMCNVGDILLRDRSDLTFHLSPKELILVFRQLDQDVCSWMYSNVMQSNRVHAAYEESAGYLFEKLESHAQPFASYELDNDEELMTMSVPAKKTTAEKKPAAEAKPKKETNPNAAWEKAGFKMDQKIHFGVDKDGKKYDTGENNPKRGASADRYKLYKEGMTIQEFKDAGGKLPDLKWDTAESRKWVVVK